MALFNRVESPRKQEDAIFNENILSGDGWMYELQAGQVIRIVDLEGNQAVDTVFYSADYPDDHYSAIQTILNQGNLYLSTGSKLLSQSCQELLEIVADTCGQHDTLGGACSAQSNTVRYSRDKLNMHNCRDSFMLAIHNFNSNYNYGKRDLAPNINFFMNVPVTPDGGMEFADGVSSPGYYVEMKAICKVVVLISNCPQLNNPCNAYNPTPAKVLIWDR